MPEAPDLASLRIDRDPPPPRGGSRVLPVALVVVALVVAGFFALRFSRAGSAITVSVGTGDVAEELVRASQDADMLVVGSRGGGGFARLLMGSVSSQVVHHASCPVVVIR